MEFLPIFLIFFGGTAVILLINAGILTASRKRAKNQEWDFLNGRKNQSQQTQSEEKQEKENTQDKPFPGSLLDVGLARAHGVRSGLGTIEVGLPVLIEQVRLLREEVVLLRKDLRKHETDPVKKK
ncbi:hypothetical protein [Syntrophotalea acetylenica]|uniref:Uncharacterized protein n=1 Tax=Syntrophotalea acetylenica TaxID=29542 RepID=A0A1L3GDS8_SYNAC|nr:hypothetical protein [Syntrophotalea acetylenica]APG23979.1 hypothetical protein A7E75_02290 [Syntrophotalea acetylenica]APG44561.1 hypothetical protein A6070_10910 [Syntrophotalea acetylenica]MDY0227706.1 hypothetical protein [Desulfomicrobium apsheronum]